MKKYLLKIAGLLLLVVAFLIFMFKLSLFHSYNPFYATVVMIVFSILILVSNFLLDKGGK